ncbi:hypothetical protein L3Q82_005403 [Scortum barcoo]|uniref:Uncharacterized protein n=1 Tax=Scortum barcoo TaxID=214431 RepID=A0ACB8VAF9_9TELE|nr:hypothetical protein L3Q82_005403 [Scortum barcoo]
MGFIHVVVAVFGLLSVGQSAPVTSCESLIKPLEIQGREQLLGKWTLIGESTNFPGSQLLKMFVGNAWVNITLAEESDGINLYQAQKIHGKCFSVKTEMTLANNTLSRSYPMSASEVLLNTGCPDCLVFHMNFTMGENTYRGLQLLSRRTTLTAAEMEEFTKQRECLGLPSPVILTSDKDFCPEESAIDLTNVANNMGSKAYNYFSEFINTEAGVKRKSAEEFLFQINSNYSDNNSILSVICMAKLVA